MLLRSTLIHGIKCYNECDLVYAAKGRTAGCCVTVPLVWSDFYGLLHFGSLNYDHGCRDGATLRARTGE